MGQNPFTGTWRLVVADKKDANGRVSYTWGKDAVGYIMYSDDGYMSVGIMSADHPKQASGDKSTASTHMSYCGRYEIQGDTVIHHVEIGSIPARAGTDLKRVFEFDGDRLILRPPSAVVDGVEVNGRIIWQRV